MALVPDRCIPSTKSAGVETFLPTFCTTTLPMFMPTVPKSEIARVDHNPSSIWRNGPRFLGRPISVRRSPRFLSFTLPWAMSRYQYALHRVSCAQGPDGIVRHCTTGSSDSVPHEPRRRSRRRAEHLLVLHTLLQPFHESDIHPSPLAVNADGDAHTLEHVGERRACERKSLSRVLGSRQASPLRRCQSMKRPGRETLGPSGGSRYRWPTLGWSVPR